MRIPSYEERVKNITSPSALRVQMGEAIHTVTAVRSWIKQQLPIELRLIPNGSRMVPHLHRPLRHAQEVERKLRLNYHHLLEQAKKRERQYYGV
jgi:hypothetical protein